MVLVGEESIGRGYPTATFLPKYLLYSVTEPLSTEVNNTSYAPSRVIVPHNYVGFPPTKAYVVVWHDYAEL